MMLNLVFVFLIGAIFSYCMLCFITMACKKYGLVDNPNWRKVHSVAVPRLGGLVFVPSLAMSMTVGLGLMSWEGELDYRMSVSMFAMIAGTISLYAVGLYDDLQDMKALTKFFIQIVASLLFPLCNLMINNLHGFCGIYELPLWISYLLTVFVILLIVNAMNLIDGIDGLASGLAIICLSVLCVLYANRAMSIFVILCISMVATLLVFFMFNVYGKVGGKKIFMGDTGSLTLGYVIAYLVIKNQMLKYSTTEESVLAFIVSFSLVLVPTLDLARVAIARKLKGKDMFEPDKTHIHHKLLAVGLSMKQTLIVILFLQMFYFMLNYGLYLLSVQMTYIVLIDLVLYAIIHILLPVETAKSKK